MREIESLVTSTEVDGIKTVYIGGGTPTVLDELFLQHLLNPLQAIIDNAEEITLEANPESVTRERLGILRQYGVNRLSIGVQSFDEKNLDILGRLNSVEMSYKAFKTARESGFENISIDLMYGLPRQHVDDWADDLHKALELGPEHISFYGLTVEEETEFEERYSEAPGRGALPSDETCRGMYYKGIDILTQAGYKHYEISNFARPGFVSKHNLNYWRHGRYLAIGPSAAGFDGKRRWKNVPDTDEYVNLVLSGKSPVSDAEVLSEKQLISEEMMLGLRLMDGIDLGKLAMKYGADIDELYGDTIRSLVDAGMVERDGGILRLTSEALFVSNMVMSEFMLV